MALIPQDTTELVLDRDPEKGFGKLTLQVGLLDHVQIAVTPLGQHLGVTRCYTWARPLVNPHGVLQGRMAGDVCGGDEISPPARSADAG